MELASLLVLVIAGALDDCHFVPSYELLPECLTPESGELNVRQNMRTIHHLNKCVNLNLFPKAILVFLYFAD